MTDHITQNLSTELYRYMCQSIVGTEDNVKQIRLMNAIRDDLSIHKNEISITSGSYGEGLDMRGSDLDVMYVVQNIKVYDVKPRLNPISAYLLMDTDNVKPGFTQLRLDSRCTSYHNCVQLGDKYYLSSSLWKEDILTKNMDYTIHGPCVSDKDGLYDFAECLHCKSWISSAVQWITRSTNSWPSNNVKQSIIKHGVLFVPIGTKGSTKEDLEWRISFSISEKMLVHTFTHTQLCCYALIKILLKDVIATDSVCKELLCSYFLKTIIFWISEELPLSSWTPDKLIPCFMQCFDRLIYCVVYSVCAHYFIPENNMFENKIEGRARKILLEKLYTLHSYGWRCVLFSDQVSTFCASMQYFSIERNPLYINDVEKTTSSTLLQLANNSFRGVFKILHSSSFTRQIQKTVSCENLSMKYLYTYYMSMMSAVRAQSIQLNNAYSKNKYQYQQYKFCLSTLLKNIYHDAVSGWLMLASFFYKTKQYTRAVRIIMDCISKCTSEKLYPYIKMSDIHHRLFKLKSLQKKSIVHLWKYVLVDDIRFEVNSLLIPDELLLEVDYNPLRIPSSVYSCFLFFLCHYNLNDARQCRDSLQVLQLVTEYNYLNADMDAKAAAYNLLGVALQTVGETETARQAYLLSAKLHIDPTDNPAVKRLFLLD
ncbi:Hypothetical predicted protein [Mytilus galloprovincialis]|uniref:Mab-21-like HhH/H2TH-like domain-containing protein n=1 Tax=Mytilus galloprovincialis TaxID=29158 RepID=A0A8B6BVA9_MYTGA|nr:Hypothetical predicted protein [Mytilus galloprovincialis]